MDIITLVNSLREENDRLVKEFLEADKNYHKARIQRDENTMAYWWNIEKKINDRINEIVTALRIIKEFAGEGPCL